MEDILKIGDEFVRKSKYGKVFGTIKSFYKTTVIDFDCNYEKIEIVSNNGILYDLSECMKVVKKLTPEEIIKRKKFLDTIEILQERKSNYHKEIKNKLIS